MALQKDTNGESSRPVLTELTITFFQEQMSLPFIAEAVMGRIEIEMKEMKPQPNERKPIR